MILLMLIFLGTASESYGGVLTPDQVLASVKAQYPVIKGAEQEVLVQQNELVASEGAFDLIWKNRLATYQLGYYQTNRIDSILEKPIPFLGTNFFGGYRLGTGNFAEYDKRFETLSSGEIRLGIEFSLWRNRSTDRRRTNLAKSELSVTASELSLVQSRIESERAAIQKYWDWVGAGNKVTVYKSLLANALERDKAIAERVKHGDLPEFERKDNERTILQRQGQLAGAERLFQQYSYELSLFIRDEQGHPKRVLFEQVPLQIGLPEFKDAWEIEKETEKAFLQRPELKRLQLQRDQMYLERDWADNQLSPRLDFQLTALRDFGDGDVTKSKPEVEASLLFEVPLETRLSSGRRDSSLAAGLRIEQSERLMRDKIRADVQDAFSLLDLSKKRAELATAETLLAKKLEQGERARFFHGDSHILLVNIREQATADAQVREIDAVIDYHKGIAQLKAVVGDYEI